MLDENAGNVRRSSRGSKGSLELGAGEHTGKRSWSNQSPTANVLKFERSSDRKRSNKSPAAGTERRTTANPDDLAALMSEFDEQTTNNDDDQTVTVSIQDITSAILSNSSSSSSRKVEREEGEEEEEEASYATNSTGNTFAAFEADDNNDGRRATADPADLAAMMAELNDTAASAVSGTSAPPTPGGTEVIKRGRGRPRKDGTPKKSDVILVSTPASTKSEEPVRPSKSTGKKSVQGQDEQEEEEADEAGGISFTDTTSSSIGALMEAAAGAGNGRRLTADAADIQALMNGLGDDEESVNTSVVSTRSTRSTRSTSSRSSQQSVASTRSTRAQAKSKAQQPAESRRMTADPADMAALLDGLDEEHNSSRASFGARTGRESIDTVVLTREVADMLDDIDNSRTDESVNVSTLSYSVASNGSSSRRSSLDLGLGAAGGRRTTADCADLAALTAELDQEEGEESHSSMQNGDSVTEATMAVIESVQQVLSATEACAGAGAMDTSASLERSNLSMSVEHAEGNESQDESTSNSLCSLGALLRRDHNMTDSPSTLRLALSVAPLEPPVSPTSSALPTTKGTGLKSCLSSRKVRPAPAAAASSVRKSVMFGSPKAAEFTRGAPTNALTPLDRAQAKSLFSMVGSAVAAARANEDEDEDDATAENSRILDEWDRLTNTTGDGSDDDIPLPPTPNFAPTDAIAAGSSSSSRRRKSMLQPRGASLDASQDSEPTCTVELPGDLSELLRENTRPDAPRHSPNASSMNMSDDRTQELEMDLESVLRHVDYDTHSIALPGAASSSGSDSNNTSTMSSRSAVSTTSTTSGASLGPLLGLPRSSATALAGSTAAGAVGTPSSETSSPMSNVASDESEVSFLKVDEATKKSVKFSLNASVSTSASVDNSVLSEGDGPTVQLEDALGCLLDSGSRSLQPAQQPKKAKRQNTPHKPAGIFGGRNDDDDEDDEDEDRTTRLEANLQDLVHQMNASSGSAQASPALSVIAASDGEDVGADISNASTRSLASPAERSMLDDSQIIGGEADEQGGNGSRMQGQQGSFEVSAMMARLRTLNAGARQNSLSQCGTPLAPASRLSLGIKRQSILNSASRARVRMMSLGGGATAGGAAAAAEPAPVVAELPTAPGPVQLVDVLEAAKLTTVSSVSESPFSLHAALESTRALSQSNPALYPLVACAIIDLLKAAVEEASNVPADLEALSSEWAAAPEAVAQSVSAAVADCDAGKSSFLPTLASSCRALCSKRWGVWEGHLLDIGTETLRARISAIQSNIKAIRAQRDSLLQTEREMNDSTRVAARRAEIEALQGKIRAARSALEASKQTLQDVGSETSSLLESHKDRMVSLAAGRDRSATANAEAAVLQRMQQQDEALYAARRAVDDVRLMVGVVNRLTHCRATSYTSSSIDVEALLCASLKVALSFSLAQDGAGRLVVTGVHVELEKTERIDGLPDREQDLAEAFFSQVLCNDDIDGALSPRALERVAVPADVPVALQKISGYVSSLRRVACWMGAFEVDGWSWSVRGGNIVAHCPNRTHSLALPLRVVLSGDVGALPVTCLRDAQDNPVVEGPMRSALSTLKVRHNASFGSFPSGPLRKAVEHILKHV